MISGVEPCIRPPFYGPLGPRVQPLGMRTPTDLTWLVNDGQAGTQIAIAEPTGTVSSRQSRAARPADRRRRRDHPGGTCGQRRGALVQSPAFGHRDEGVSVVFEDDERTSEVTTRLLEDRVAWMSGSRWRGWWVIVDVPDQKLAAAMYLNPYTILVPVETVNAHQPFGYERHGITAAATARC